MNQYRSTKALVLDLDGTIVDSLPDLAGALAGTLASRGLTMPPDDVVRSSANLGMAGMVAAAVSFGGLADRRDELAILDEFEKAYAARLFEDSRLFPGVRETLQDLRSAGWRLAVCTNKREALSRRLLDHAGIAGLFEAVIGGDTTGEPKPSARPLLAAIEACACAPSSAVLVGDSEVDFECARNARVPLVMISHGYASDRGLYLSLRWVVDGFGQLGRLLAVRDASSLADDGRRFAAGG